MNKREFKQAVTKLLSTAVDDLTLDERIAVLRRTVVEIERAAPVDDSNKGKPWSNAELRTILRSAPTMENCVGFAKAFRRGYGSIEQIYRWAAEDQRSIDDKRPD